MLVVEPRRISMYFQSGFRRITSSAKDKKHMERIEQTCKLNKGRDTCIPKSSQLEVETRAAELPKSNSQGPLRRVSETKC